MIKKSINILVFLFIICVILNPSIESHRKAVLEKFNKRIIAADSSDFDFKWASNSLQISKVIGKVLFEKSVSIQYYYYYSLTRMDVGTNRKVVGIGFLNYVYIYDEIFATRIEYNNRIIGKPIRIAYFEVAENDFPVTLNWYDARDACLNLGDGWRLPNYYEVVMIRMNQDKLEGWSLDNSPSSYWGVSDNKQSFKWYKEHSPFGPSYNLDEKSSVNVRAVRSIKH